MDGCLQRNLVITGRSISAAIRHSIRAQLKENQCSELSDDLECVKGLLVALENLFYHGLRYDGDLSKLGKRNHPWSLFNSFSSEPSTGVQIVQVLDNLNNNFAKIRSWIRVSLINHSFHNILLQIRRQEQRFRKIYYDEALLLSNDLTTIITESIQLEKIQYSLDLKSSEINYNGVPPIDYSIYLSPGNLNASCSCDANNDPQRRLDNRDREIHYLKEANNAALEKTCRLEKLLAERNEQLQSQAEQLSASEHRQRDLECQVLELQIQVTLFHEQCMQELQKAGIKDTRLIPPTVKRWTEVSKRRQRLVDQAYSATSRCSVAPYLTQSTTVQHRPTAATRCGPMPSILHVDQGIDALSYESAEDCTQSMTSSILSRRTAQPRCSSALTTQSKDGMEIGEEVAIDPELPKRPLTLTAPSLTDEEHGKQTASTSVHPIKTVDPCPQPGTSYHPLQSDPQSTVRLESSPCFGVQQMPETGEQFILATDRFSPTTLSNTCSLNELPCAGARNSTRAGSHDLCPPSKTLATRGTLTPLPRRSTPVLSRDHSSPGSTSPLRRSHTASPRLTAAPKFVEQSPLVHRLAPAPSENQALVDSLTSDDRMDMSSDLSSQDLIHSNKDFYQLTSQSEEDLISDPDAADCVARHPLSSHTRKRSRNMGAKVEPTALAYPASAAPSHSSQSSTPNVTVPQDTTPSGET